MGEDFEASIEVLDFRFRSANKLRLFEEWPAFPTSLDVLACASTFGLIIIGTPNGIFVFKVSEVLEHDNNKQRPRTIPMGGITHLSVNSDDTLLMVAFTNDQRSHAHILKVEDLLSVNQLKIYAQIVLSSECGLSEIAWNPTNPRCVCCCMINGSLMMLEIKDADSIGIVNSLSNAEATCISWSPRGKQLVAGSRKGILTQYNPELKAVKSHPLPQTLQPPAEAFAVAWLSSYQFAVVYKLGSAEENQLSLCIVNAPKQGPITCIYYDDICYSSSELRVHQFYLRVLQNWNILLCGSANSMEIGVLGQCEGEAQPPRWQQWTTDDSARAELPLDNAIETFPIGVTVDTSSTKSLPWGEGSVAPMPVMFVLSNRGMLCAFHVMNLKPNAINLCSPPRDIPDNRLKILPPSQTQTPVSQSQQIQQQSQVQRPQVTQQMQQTQVQRPQVTQQMQQAQVLQRPQVTQQMPRSQVTQQMQQAQVQRPQESQTQQVQQAQVQRPQIPQMQQMQRPQMPQMQQPQMSQTQQMQQLQMQRPQVSQMQQSPVSQSPIQHTQMQQDQALEKQLQGKQPEPQVHQVPVKQLQTAETPKSQEPIDSLEDLPVEAVFATITKIIEIFSEEMSGSLSRFQEQIKLIKKTSDLEEQFEELREEVVKNSHEIEASVYDYSMRDQEHQSNIKIFEDINSTITTTAMPEFVKLLRCRPLDEATTSQQKDVQRNILYIESEIHQVLEAMASKNLTGADTKKDKFGYSQKMSRNATIGHISNILKILEHNFEKLKNKAKADSNLLYNENESFLEMHSMSEALNTIRTECNKHKMTSLSVQNEEAAYEVSDIDYVPQSDVILTVTPVPKISPRKQTSTPKKIQDSNLFCQWRQPETALLDSPVVAGSVPKIIQQSFSTLSAPQVPFTFTSKVDTIHSTPSLFGTRPLENKSEPAKPFAFSLSTVQQPTGPIKLTTREDQSFEAVSSDDKTSETSSSDQEEVITQVSSDLASLSNLAEKTNHSFGLSSYMLEQVSEPTKFGTKGTFSGPDVILVPPVTNSAAAATIKKTVAFNPHVPTSVVTSNTSVKTTGSLSKTTNIFGGTSTSKPLFGNSASQTSAPSIFGTFSTPSMIFGTAKTTTSDIQDGASITTTVNPVTTLSSLLFSSSDGLFSANTPATKSSEIATTSTSSFGSSTLVANTSSPTTSCESLFDNVTSTTSVFGGDRTNITSTLSAATSTSTTSGLFGKVVLVPTTASTAPVFGSITTTSPNTETTSTKAFATPTTSVFEPFTGTTASTTSGTPFSSGTTSTKPSTLLGTVSTATSIPTTSVIGTPATLVFGSTTSSPVFGSATSTTVFSSTPSVLSPTTSTPVFVSTPPVSTLAVTTSPTINTPSFKSVTTSALSTPLFGTVATTAAPGTPLFGTVASTPPLGTPPFGTVVVTTPAPVTPLFGSVTTTTPTISTPSVVSVTTTSSSGAPLFGSVTTTTTPTTSIPSFASIATTPASGTPPFFGTVATTTTTTPVTPLFSNITTTTTTPTGPLFGSDATTTPAPNTNIFGGQSALVFGSTSDTPKFDASGFSTNSFTGFAQTPTTSTNVFGQAASPSTDSTSQVTNMFGGMLGSPPGGNLFGSSSFSKPASSIFGGSPAANSANNSQNLFGNLQPCGIFSTTGNKTEVSKNVFGASPTQNPFSKPSVSAIFGQSGSGTSQAFGQPAVFGQAASPGSSPFSQSSTQSGNLFRGSSFGSPPAFGGAPIFGGPPVLGTTTMGSGLFGSLPAAPATQESNPFSTLASQNTVTFGNLANQPATNNNQQSGGSFGGSSFSSWR